MNYQSHKGKRGFTRNHVLSSNADMFSILPQSSIKKDHFRTLTVPVTNYHSIKNNSRFGILTTTSPTFSGIISSKEKRAPPARNPSLISLEKSVRVLEQRLSQTNLFENKLTSITTAGTATASENKADFNFQFKRLKIKADFRPEHFQICRVIIRNARKSYGSSREVQKNYIPLRQSNLPRRAKSTSVKAQRNRSTSIETKKTDFLFPKLFRSFMKEAPSNLHVHDLIVKVKKVSMALKISLEASLNLIERCSIKDKRVTSFIKYQMTRKWFCKWIKAYLKVVQNWSPYVSRPVLNVNTKTNQIATIDSQRDQIFLSKTSPQMQKFIKTTDPSSYPRRTNLQSIESLTKSLSRLSSPRARKPLFDAFDKFQKLVGKMYTQRFMTIWVKQTVQARVLTMKHYAAMLEIKAWRGFKCYFNRMKQIKLFQTYNSLRTKKQFMNAIRLLYYSKMVVSFRQNQARNKYIMFLKRRAMKRMFLFARFTMRRNNKFLKISLVKAMNAFVGSNLKTYLANSKRIKFFYKKRIISTLNLEDSCVKGIVFGVLKSNSQLLIKFKFRKVVGQLKKGIQFWQNWAIKNKKARQFLETRNQKHENRAYQAWRKVYQIRQRILGAADTIRGAVRRNLLKFHFSIIVKERSLLVKQRQVSLTHLKTLCKRVLRSYAVYHSMLATKRERVANLIYTLKTSKARRILNACASYSESRHLERSSRSRMGLKVRKNCLKRFFFVWTQQIRVKIRMLALRRRQTLRKLRQACQIMKTFHHLAAKADAMAKLWAQRKIVLFLSRQKQLQLWYKQAIEIFKQLTNKAQRLQVLRSLHHHQQKNQNCRLADEKISIRHSNQLRKLIFSQLKTNAEMNQKIRLFQVQQMLKKKLIYLHHLKKVGHKIKTLRMNYISLFTSKFRVICKKMLTNWSRISKIKQDKRKELNSLQQKYLQRKGLQKIITYCQFKQQQKLVQDFLVKIQRKMVEKRAFHCLKRYLDLNEIKQVRIKELGYRKLRLALAFRSLRKIVTLKQKTDFIEDKVNLRVKAEMMGMWQSIMFKQIMINNLLKTKEMRQSCKVFQALIANKRYQLKKKASSTMAQKFHTMHLLKRSILSMQKLVQQRIEKQNLADLKEKLASKQRMLVIWCEWHRVCRKLRFQLAIGYHIKKRVELRTKKFFLSRFMSAGSHQQKCRVITFKGIASLKKVVFNGLKQFLAKKKLLQRRFKISEQKKGKHLARSVLCALKSFVKLAKRGILAQQISKQHCQRRIMMLGYLQIVKFTEKSRRLRAVMRRVMIKRRLNQKRQWLRAMVKISKSKNEKDYQSPPETVRLLKANKFDCINLRLLEAVEKQNQEKVQYFTVQPVNQEKLLKQNLIKIQDYSNSSGTRSDISNQENRIQQIGSHKPPKRVLKSGHKSQSPSIRSCMLRQLSPMILTSLQ